jgi:phospholipid-binding lipoprotein MlaA
VTVIPKTGSAATAPRRRAGPVRLAATLLLGLVLVGCAARPDPADPEAVAEFEQTNDPLEPLNRGMFVVNDGLDTLVLRPAAEAYRIFIPPEIRTSVRNMLGNLRSPVILLNDVLQGETQRAGTTLGRFVLNTTLGVGGLFDVAGKSGITREPADFGQTLGRWGVGEGPYIYVPVIGPTTLRDGVGGLVGTIADPVSQATGGLDTDFAMARSVIRGVEARSEADALLTSVMTDSTDPYATVRGAYLQSRAAAVAAARGEAADLPDFEETLPEELN